MKQYFSIIKRAYLWFFIGLGLTIISWILFIFNIEYSEEFTGWVGIVFNGKVDGADFSEKITHYLEENDFPKLNVNVEQALNEVKIKINVKLESDEKVTQLSTLLEQYLIENNYVQNNEQIIEQAIIGPSVGDYMKTTAFKALIFGIIAMVIYMIFSFGTIRKYIPPTVLAITVVLSAFLSISIPMGAYGLWMTINSTVQVDTVFVIAILTIIGYGINDVIVIFDRVRENMIKDTKKKGSYLQLFEDSLRQTMKRSLGTSLSTLLVLCAMFVFGTGVIQRFAFTVGVGVITSFCVSIFIAVPTAYLLLSKNKK